MAKQKETELIRLLRRGISYEFGKKTMAPDGTGIGPASSDGMSCYILKQHGSQYTGAGIPDILACIRGHFVAIEAKVLPNRPSPAQLVHMSQIIDSGGIGFWLVANENLDRFYWLHGGSKPSYRNMEVYYSSLLKMDKDGKQLMVDCTFLSSIIKMRK